MLTRTLRRRRGRRALAAVAWVICTLLTSCTENTEATAAAANGLRRNSHLAIGSDGAAQGGSELPEKPEGVGDSSASPNGLVYPVRLEDGFGFMDHRGRVTATRFPGLLFDVHEGLAVFFDTRGWGFADSSGNIVITGTFGRANPFSEGLAAVALNEKWGYINTAGEVQIEARFDDALPFSEGVACVALDGKYGFIDRTGRFILSPQFDYIELPFSEGVVPVRRDSATVYVDAGGRQRIPESFEDGGSFSEGLAPVRKSGKWGYINHDGIFVIAPAFDDALEFSEGLAAVSVLDEAALSYDGELLVVKDGPGTVDPSVLEATKSIKEMLGKIRWGYIRRNGAWAIPAKFVHAYSYRGGLAAVTIWESESTRSSHVYVDRAGSVISISVE